MKKSIKFILILVIILLLTLPFMFCSKQHGTLTIKLTGAFGNSDDTFYFEVYPAGASIDDVTPMAEGSEIISSSGNVEVTVKKDDEYTEPYVFMAGQVIDLSVFIDADDDGVKSSGDSAKVFKEIEVDGNIIYEITIGDLQLVD
jgi:hypothetical protein